jgi:YD repeat-containing protein
MRERPQDRRTFDEETTMNPIRIAKNWISYRRTMNELGNLSAQTLNDIGITRYEIRNIASRSFR